MKIQFFLGISGILILSACGGSTSSSNASGTSASSKFTSEAVISSPFTTSTSNSSQVIHAQTSAAETYAARKAVIKALLDATAVANCKFAFDLTKGNDRTNCYGPTVTLGGNHPDSNAPANPNNLPGGDLGIWDSTNDGKQACTAAQINSLVNSHTKKAYFAQLVSAGLSCFAATSGIAFPENGKTTTLTADQLTSFSFTKDKDVLTATAATITGIQDSAGNAGFRYEIRGTASDEGGAALPFHVVSQFATNSAGYRGTASYAIKEASATGGNCQGTTGKNPSGLTFAGKMIYDKNTSASEINILLDHAEFCGIKDGDTDPLNTTTFAIDPCNKLEGNNKNGWGENWNHIHFKFNTSTDTGDYVAVWSAGQGDPKTRLFNAKISKEGSTTTGTGWFGYGKRIASGTSGSACTATASTDLGKIEGIICNWVGPQGFLSKTPEQQQGANAMPALVQKQAMTKDSSGNWTVSSEKIRYAPTNSCNYDGLGNFTYNTQNSAASNDSTKVGVGAKLDLDTLANHQAAFTLPTAPSF